MLSTAAVSSTQLFTAEGGCRRSSRCCSSSRGQGELGVGICLSATQGMVLPHFFPCHSRCTPSQFHPPGAQGAACPNPPAPTSFVSGSLSPTIPLAMLCRAQSHPTAFPVLPSTCFPLEHCLFVGSVSWGQQESPCSVNSVLSLNSGSLSLIKY